ncbi:hypothetical protein BCU84_12740 [Shewanella sp. 10N.286.51.B7]|uniref:DUF4937 domain-containing protein n=1 Tax=Shewanella sp. 10N.286.51.B7 TaxID=1880836 RepID=UPI000C826229|nr:DUF4937 domain-containing protein [Shewanella sp. 10N.286.51.B7]PMG76639.1 hypothetical protein BCU84_12740 [Shewanella sp. 10N.286.51.B7]
MTLAKIIICQVTDEKIQSFTHSQSLWGLTASCEGFIGQLGGWVQGECAQVSREHSSDSYNQAVVIGLWQSQQGLTDFMGSAHDNIIEQNQQTSTYLACQVNRHQHVLTMGLNALDIPEIQLISMVTCEGAIDKQKFIAEQKDFWVPTLQKQPGFIGGDVWQREKDSNNYLVLTYWSNEQAYRAYDIGVFTELTQLIDQQNITQVPTKKPSAKKVSSKTVLVERRWDVIAHK